MTFSRKKSDIIHIYWPKPLEINFLQIKNADDVATISCKVGGVTIPYAMIDSRSDSSIISENVANYLGFKIDRKKIHRLNGIASKSQSLGTINDIPVTIGDGGIVLLPQMISLLFLQNMIIMERSYPYSFLECNSSIVQDGNPW